MQNKTWRWVVGLIYIFLVAAIWIAASFVVQSVVDAGVSPFLVTYICNSLFVVYIPLVEIGRYLEDHCENLFFWRKKNNSNLQELGESEQAILLEECDLGAKSDQPNPSSLIEDEKPNADNVGFPVELIPHVLEKTSHVEGSEGIDQKGRWTRVRVAKVSLVICPFWFLAQLTFNLSLKYTTVTSNTILSTSSSLFTFLVSLVFLGEKFTWVKLVSVLLCMAGTIIVSLGDSETGVSEVASSPLLGDFLALVSAAMYAIYITLIRVKLPNDDGKNGTVSTAQFLGFLGLFNLFIFLPVALVLHFTMLEPFNVLTGEQFGLIVGKGLLDNVLSDYLWAKAVLLTTTTVATAGLTIQVPLAAVVDSLTGHAPQVTEYLGALAVMIGFAGINLPSKEADFEPENQNITAHQEQQHLPTSQRAADI